MNQQRTLPKDFQLGYNPVQSSSSYQSTNRQPTRVLPTASFQTQAQIPVPSFTERMCFSPQTCISFYFGIHFS